MAMLIVCLFTKFLIEKSKQAIHGIIREVSLVVAGANPGAKIESLAAKSAEKVVFSSSACPRILSGIIMQVLPYKGLFSSIVAENASP